MDTMIHYIIENGVAMPTQHPITTKVTCINNACYHMYKRNTSSKTTTLSLEEILKT